MTNEIVITGKTFPQEALAALGGLGFSVRSIPGDLTAAQVVDELRHAWGYVLGGAERMPASAWRSLPSLRLVCFLGTGWQSFIELPRETVPIAFSYTPHANAEAVAEFGLGLLLSSVRRITAVAVGVGNGTWSQVSTGSLLGATLGIIGMGHVGRSLARMFSPAFGGRVVYWNRSDRPDNALLPFPRKPSIRDVCRDADHVAITLSYQPGATDILLDAASLSEIGPAGVLVNIGRAELIAPSILREVLTARSVGYAALDGYYQEPSPLRTMDPHGLLSMFPEKLLVTPHCAYLSSHAIRAMAGMALQNIEAVMRKEPPPYAC